MNTCPLLLTMFAPSVLQWVLSQNTAHQDVLGEGEGVPARKVVDGGFDLECDLPTEVRVRCGHLGWCDDYEGGPSPISNMLLRFVRLF